MKSLSATETARTDYRALIAAIANDWKSWEDVPDTQRVQLYDACLRVDGPGEAWTALIEHDNDHGEGCSALWMFRAAMLMPDAESTAQRVWPLAERVVARLIDNLSAYYATRIQRDLDREWCDLREADLPWWERAYIKECYRDYANRVRDSR